MDNLNRFTQSAREVLRAAQQEAIRLHHEEVTPEHITLALSIHQRAMALAIFRELGVDIPRMQRHLREIAGKVRINGRTAAISRRFERVIELAVDEAKVFGSPEVGTQHLLLGVIREGGSARSVLADQGVSLFGVHKLLRSMVFRDGKLLPPIDLNRAPIVGSPIVRAVFGVPVRPSPIFLGIVGVTALAGLAAYLNFPIPQIPVILFVLGGWLIALCLHEFGHSAVAFLGGDSTVVLKGYLTLNPAKYAHLFLSVILPLIFVLIGGIPLPGGAVYIQRSLIRDRRMRSLMSAAGPGANLAFALVLLIPYHLIARWDGAQHPAFWGAYAFLMFLNILAVVINLLPIPGIDGFGVLEPFLPLHIAEAANRILPYSFLILFLILWVPNPISAAIFGAAGALAGLAGIDFALVATGRGWFRLF